MKIQLQTKLPAEVEADALAILAFEPETGVQAEDSPLANQAGWLAEARLSGEFTGKLYEFLTLPRPDGLRARRLIVAGAGKRAKFTAVEARRVAGALVRFLKPKNVRHVALVLAGATAELAPAAVAAAVVEGAVLAAWEPDKYRTDPKKNDKFVDTFTVVVENGDAAALQSAIEAARITAESQNLTRDLVNEPANRLYPEDLAQASRKMAGESGLECEILDRDAMAQLGMGALLGVAQGSDRPPFLIVLKYRPQSPASADHLCLVGKGVTFDTGGISIKQADGMEKMKYDMAGAAAVIGAMRAIAQLKPSIAVTGYIPTVENMINGNAQRPGDIVTSLAGKTIEVLNTDAEGRLILADAITYANRNGATHIVDAATLTGAINVALGQYNIGSFTNNDDFLARFHAAARGAGEKVWQLPLEEDYKEYLKSAFADLPNIGGRAAGSITAAWFLREFADPTPWVHLDIAATAWLDDPKPWLSKGPTGVAVRSFVYLATHWSEGKQ